MTHVCDGHAAALTQPSRSLHGLHRVLQALLDPHAVQSQHELDAEGRLHYAVAPVKLSMMVMEEKARST